jgi:hypothetical protein
MNKEEIEASLKKKCELSPLGITLYEENKERMLAMLNEKAEVTGEPINDWDTHEVTKMLLEEKLKGIIERQNRMSKEKSQYEVELNKKVVRGIRALRKHGETND